MLPAGSSVYESYITDAQPSLVSTLEPVVTLVASVVILSEPITINLILGGGLVVASLLITILPQRDKKQNS